MCCDVRRLIDNVAARVLWRTYCNAERVLIPTFLEAVRLFLLHHLMVADSVVSTLLSPSNCAALMAAVDVNEDGQVEAAFFAIVTVHLGVLHPINLGQHVLLSFISAAVGPC
jgi:hypothetical protein